MEFTNGFIHLDTLVLSILVGIFLPLVTGVVTKMRAGSSTKAVVNSVLIVVTGALTTLSQEPETGIALKDFLFAVAFAAFSSWGMHRHVWVPTGATQRVQEATAGFGIGHEPQHLAR